MKRFLLARSARILLMTSIFSANANSLEFLNDWPDVSVAGLRDEALEQRVQSILEQMTLEEKVGQMIQPDLREVTPAEAKEYKLGSILNGGGAWPNDNKYSSAADWARESEKFYQALEQAYEGRGFRVPFMWATDAVHGHNNVFGSTLFPHNIGLGAARDPDLIERIGRATASEISSTGLDLTFAPTVAVPRNYRWGRVYEGYSESPEITYQYAERMVKGLQGDITTGLDSGKVLSTVKHWVGDGGTQDGVDRGENHYTEQELINIHAPGYFSALKSGAQVVMTSFNSWHNDANYSVDEDPGYNYKLHGSRYILTEVLKEKMGFDGVIVTDWNGHSEIANCTSDNCPPVVLAGNDLLMITARNDWQGFYRNLIQQVKDGVVPMDRIDDAVTRILRVKMRAGLWEKASPANRPNSGDATLLGSEANRELAQEAVRKSLVLLKNENQLLPLDHTQSLFVLGSGADDIQRQTGGWSLTWQGDENTIERDFPGASTVLRSAQKLVGVDKVNTNADTANQGDIALVVFGEFPYAEMMGDIPASKTIEYAGIKRAYQKDLALLRSLNERGVKVVSVFYSGRPLYMTEEINLSDAFVAAWLPGTEADGITDVLFDHTDHDFVGRLSFSWPASKCGDTVNKIPDSMTELGLPAVEAQIPREDRAALFPYGYGLSLDKSKSDHMGIDASDFELDGEAFACGDIADGGPASEDQFLFGRLADDEFKMYISGNANGWQGVSTSRGTRSTIPGVSTYPIDYEHQQDGLAVEFDGSGPSQLYLGLDGVSSVNKSGYLAAGASLEFDIRLRSEVPENTVLAMHCIWPCLGEMKLREALTDQAKLNEWSTIKIDLAEFADRGLDFGQISAPFLIYSPDAFEFDIGRVTFSLSQ